MQANRMGPHPGLETELAPAMSWPDSAGRHVILAQETQSLPAGLSERRERLNALGSRYFIAPDVKIEPVQADGIRAEWTTTPDADPTPVIMFLHGGAYISDERLLDPDSTDTLTDRAIVQP